MELGIFDLIESLFPIVVFFFWIAITLFVNNKKRKPKKQYQPQKAGTAQQNKNGEISLGDAIKKTLEVILGEMNPEQAPAPIPMPKEEYPERTKTEEIRTEKTEPKKVNIKKPVESLALKEHSCQSFSKREQQNLVTQKKQDKAYSFHKETRARINIGRKKFKEAVILSEILAPPVSLRD